MSYNLTLMGQRIKERRESKRINGKKMTKAQLAEKCGDIQYQTVSSWESGNAVPSLKKIIDLSAALDCDIDYLLGADSPPRRKIAEIREETALSEKAIENIIFISKHQTDPVYDSQRELIDAILEDEHFLHDTARLLLSYFSIPDNASCHMSFTDCCDSQLEADYPIFDNTDELKKLFRVNLQNVIYKFLENQFKI